MISRLDTERRDNVGGSLVGAYMDSVTSIFSLAEEGGEGVNPVVAPSLTCAAEHGLDVENGIDNGLHSRFSL